MFSPFSVNGGVSPNVPALFEQCSMLSAVAWGRPDQAGAILSALDGGTQLHFAYDQTSYAPARAIYRQANNLFIYIAGTNQLRLNLYNIAGSLVDLFTGFPGIYTNRFFGLILDSLIANEVTALPPDWRTCNIMLAGHSQGAALTLMLGAYLTTQGLTTQYDWFGFAAPRAFCGPGMLPSPARPRWGFVVVNANDAVPRVPPNDVAWVLRASPSSLFRWTAHADWTHYGRITTIQNNQYNTINPGDSEPGLDVASLTAVGSTHPLLSYLNTIQTLAGL